MGIIKDIENEITRLNEQLISEIEAGDSKQIAEVINDLIDAKIKVEIIKLRRGDIIRT